MVQLILLFLLFTADTADEFAEKMAVYYGYPVSYEMRDLPYDYWGATVWDGRCTRTVYLDTRFYTYPEEPWRFILAHEWAHTIVPNCRDEYEVNLTALKKLAKAGEISAALEGVSFLYTRHDYDPKELLLWVIANMRETRERLYYDTSLY